MFISIILSTTLLFVSFSIGASYETAQIKMSRGMSGSASISIASINKEPISGLDIPNLASIKNKVGIVKSSSLYHEDCYYETIDLIGSQLNELSKINKPKLTSGGEIEDFSGDKIILPDRFTSQYGVKKGDTITLKIMGSSHEFTVSDIAAYDTVFLRKTRGATALIPESTLRNILNYGQGYSEILLEPSSEVSTESLEQELSKLLAGKGFQISTTINETQISADARQKTMPFFLISFFSLTMSIFIIFSSYKVITLERIPTIGTFRSIGATEKMVTKILLLESLFYGCIGGILGIPSGILILKILLGDLGQFLAQGIEIPVVISPIGIYISLFVAIFVSLLSAYIPVRRASKLSVKDIILGSIEEKHISNKLVIIIGLILLIMSIILPRVSSGNLLYLAGGLSLLGLIAAAILTIPSFVSMCSKILEGIYQFIFGNEGRIAARNLKDNKNAIQTITLLFISISAIIAINVVGDFVTSYIGDVFQGAQIEGFVDAKLDDTFIASVEEMDGIEKLLPLYVLNGQLAGNGIPFDRVEATNNLELYRSMFALKFDEKMLENSFEIFNSQRSVIINSDILKQTGLAVGDTISLSNGLSKEEYKILGGFKSRADDSDVVISSKFAVTDFGANHYDFLAYTASDPDAIMIQMRELLGDTQNWSRTIEEFNHDALNTVGSFLKPMHKMTYFILLLSTIGIINNLLINYIQKRRSIAMYKSLGLSNKQNVKIMLIEGFTIGLLGAAVAIIISYLEISTIFIVAGPKIAVTPTLALNTFMIAGFLGVFITLIGSIAPIVKGNKMNLVQEIKCE